MLSIHFSCIIQFSIILYSYTHDEFQKFACLNFLFENKINRKFGIKICVVKHQHRCQIFIIITLYIKIWRIRNLNIYDINQHQWNKIN